MNAKDPVCGMQIDVQEAAASTTHRGQTYHFCCEGCLRQFEQDPAAYLAGGTGEVGHAHRH
jgi:YHS domain-containing protein